MNSGGKSSAGGEKKAGEPTFTKVTLALPQEVPGALRPVLEASDAARPSAAELFERHVTFVWRVVAAHGVREADVADVTQDVFVIAFRRLESWDPRRSSATSWLYGIAVRSAANHRKKAHVRREQSSEGAHGNASVPPEAVEHQVVLSELAHALMTLDDGKRDAFVLFEIAELSMQEVAVTLGCPLKTAYKRLYAARRAIAERLGDKGST